MYNEPLLWPADCTCRRQHTEVVDPSITDEALNLMALTAECPAESRALLRILQSRKFHLG